MDKLTFAKPNDFHIHLRQGLDLVHYVQDCGPWFEKILVMPNTIPPVTTANHIQDFTRQIKNACSDIQPYLAYKIVKGIEGEIPGLHEAGAISGKLYPEGVTTNSEDGVRNIEEFYEHFEIMQRLGLILNIHAEHPDSFCLDREYDYLETVEKIIEKFPNLKIVIEHISDKRTVQFVKSQGKNVAATITIHHLLLTLDDVVGGNINPHHFCKPIAKRGQDKTAILDAAFSGNPKFFLGTDSAPHSKEKKECAHGCAGVYSAPVAIPLLIEIFEKAGHLSDLKKLENFSSHFACDFYGLPRNTKQIHLIKKDFKVPDIIHGVVPFYAGQLLKWQIDSAA